eukprot:scaffold109_cov252-Pinguiococcus_pyrenoidosus.AAC.94
MPSLPASRTLLSVASRGSTAASAAALSPASSRSSTGHPDVERHISAHVAECRRRPSVPREAPFPPEPEFSEPRTRRCSSEADAGCGGRALCSEGALPLWCRCRRGGDPPDVPAGVREDGAAASCGGPGPKAPGPQHARDGARHRAGAWRPRPVSRPAALAVLRVPAVGSALQRVRALVGLGAGRRSAGRGQGRLDGDLRLAGRHHGGDHGDDADAERADQADPRRTPRHKRAEIPDVPLEPVPDSSRLRRMERPFRRHDADGAQGCREQHDPLQHLRADEGFPRQACWHARLGVDGRASFRWRDRRRRERPCFSRPSSYAQIDRHLPRAMSCRKVVAMPTMCAAAVSARSIKEPNDTGTILADGNVRSTSTWRARWGEGRGNEISTS